MVEIGLDEFFEWNVARLETVLGPFQRRKIGDF